jgi:hypothetical protein
MNALEGLLFCENRSILVGFLLDFGGFFREFFGHATHLPSRRGILVGFILQLRSLGIFKLRFPISRFCGHNRSPPVDVAFLSEGCDRIRAFASFGLQKNVRISIAASLRREASPVQVLRLSVSVDAASSPATDRHARYARSPTHRDRDRSYSPECAGVWDSFKQPAKLSAPFGAESLPAIRDSARWPGPSTLVTRTPGNVPSSYQCSCNPGIDKPE